MAENHLHALFGKSFLSPTRETLYVTQSSAETTDIGLFIDPSHVSQAEKFVGAPQNGSLDAFCVALEGVSHFLYLTYCSAALKRPVTQIELELQAEVDKYLLLRVLFGIKDSASRLFSSFQLHDGVAEQAKERYQVAHRHARRYAGWMESQVRDGDIAGVIADARAFYRKPLSCKLAHIAISV